MEDQKPLSEALAEKLQAETATSQDAKVEMTPEAKVAAEEEAKKALTPRGKLDALLKKQKSEGLTVSETLRVNRLRKEIKAHLKQQGSYERLVQKMYVEPQKRAQKRMMARVDAVRSTLGKENFKMLKDLYRVNVAEQKNDKGEVVQKATSYINWYGLLQEATHVIALQRDERIKAGTRKRTTGRSSDRRAHRDLMQFIRNRDTAAAQEPAKA